MPELIRSGRVRADVLMLQLAPAPDGMSFSFSVGQEYLVAALEAARVVVAEVNDQAPWSCSERVAHPGEIDFILKTSRRPFELQRREAGPLDLVIARNVASLIGDRSTLQLGIGVLPETVMTQLLDRIDLGIHS